MFYHLNLYIDTCSTFNFSFLICKYKGIICGEMGIILSRISLVAGHKKMTKSNYLSLSNICQNPVNMHTSIMCINILQNIKAVAPKL